MAKIDVLRKGCFVEIDGKNVQLEMGEQEVSDTIANYMCTNKYATAIVEAIVLEEPEAEVEAEAVVEPTVESEVEVDTKGKQTKKSK